MVSDRVSEVLVARIGLIGVVQMPTSDQAVLGNSSTSVAVADDDVFRVFSRCFRFVRSRRRRRSLSQSPVQMLLKKLPI